MAKQPTILINHHDYRGIAGVVRYHGTASGVPFSVHVKVSKSGQIHFIFDAGNKLSLDIELVEAAVRAYGLRDPKQFDKR